jgi:hypothetical protein
MSLNFGMLVHQLERNSPKLHEIKYNNLQICINTWQYVKLLHVK